MYQRFLSETIQSGLSDTPVVFIRGARQTGKTTLSREIISSEHKANYITLDSAAVLSAAATDPVGFITHLHKPVTIDEVQRVPELILAIKEDVDHNRNPGRYLLTGSANILTIPKVADSLAGRMEIVTLWPLSRGEIAGVKESFIRKVFKGESIGLSFSRIGIEDLADMIITGGYPEPVKRTSFDRKTAWFDSYLTTILERDIRNLANIHDIAIVPRLLRLLGSRTGGLRDYSELSRSLSVPTTSLIRYMSLLEGIFLVYTVPAWSSNFGKRLIKSPKVFFTDTGIASYLLGIDKERLLADPILTGKLFENFVSSELSKQMAWSGMRTRIYHFRTQAGQEVDFVLEDSSGRVCGIEVKLSASITAKHFIGLRELHRLAGDNFVAGIVIYTGEQIVPFGNNLFGVPVSALWG